MEHRSLAPNLVISTDDNAGRNQLAGEPAPDVAQKELFKEKQMGRAVNCNDLELSTYLQALAEGYLPTFYSDTSQSAQSKSMSIASKSFRRGKKTVVFHGFPSLKMSRHSTADLGRELLTSFVAGFPAKTSALPEKAKGSTESDPECGQKWHGSLAKYDPGTRSWRTPQSSLVEGLDEFSETWPRWGSMRNGECWERETAEPITRGSASGFWPTPNACTASFVPNLQKSGDGRKKPNKLGWAVAASTSTPGRMNPEWTEWLMGWPIGHTDLKPLETDKFREWQQQHGPC